MPTLLADLPPREASALREAIGSHYHADETRSVEELLGELHLGPGVRERIVVRARRLAQRLRDEAGAQGAASRPSCRPTAWIPTRASC